MNDNIKAGADIHSGDGGYSVGTKEKYDEFIKGRNQSLGKMRVKALINKVGTDVSGKWVGIDNVELLAELIVKECAGLFPNVYVEIEDEYGHTPVIAADYIKKHFGVEE
jgi:hypothetical protein